MLTNIVSQTSPGAGSLYIRASSSNVLAPVSASLMLNGRHHQQARSYRCGIWSSYLGPELQRHSRRRHRVIKYRYAESQNRKSSWDQNPLVNDAKTALRQAIGKYWQAGASLCGSRMVSYGSRPSQPNEEANQKYGAQKSGPGSSAWTTPLGDAINRWTKQSSPGVKRAGSRYEPSTTATSSSAGTSPEEDFIIDPITNRKVISKTYRARESDNEPSLGLFGYQLSAKVQALGRRPEVPCSTRHWAAAHHQVQSEEYSLNHLPPEDQAEVYDDLHNYKPTEHDEIKDVSAQPAPKYNDLHEYRPAEHDEIKGIAADSAPKYDDLHKYNPTEHDEIKYDWEKPVQKYQDLHSYRPTEHDEITTPTPPSAPKYDDLSDYKPFRYRESDATQTESSPVYDDLHKYRPYMYNEDAQSDEVAAAAPKYDDLDKYKSHLDPIERVVDSAKPKYEDLDQYQPYLHQEGRSNTNQGSQYKDLNKYRSGVSEEPQTAPEGEPFEQYGDLDQYKSAYRFQEPDGKAPVEQDPVEEGLGEFDAKKENRENLEQAMTGHIEVSDAIDREVSAGLQRSRQRAAQEEPSVNIFRDSPENFMELLKEFKENGMDAATYGPVSDEARQADIQSAEKDYTDSLTHNLNSTLEPALGRMNAAANEPANDGTSQGIETSTIEDGQKDDAKQAEAHMQKYGDPTPQEDPISVFSNPPPPDVDVVEPTIYKVLALDPWTQDVSIAETTSTVPDQTTPLTPSEVLLRLSNPTKFFPHFEPLREEGFEIVSGNGDVLVFRKVRDPTSSTASASSEQEEPDTASSSSANNHPVNPIDMMGRYPLPNAAAFASPTGFVNYNDSFVEEPPEPLPQQPQSQSPPFRSDVEVRRVFSGPKVNADNSEKKAATAMGTKKMKKKRSLTRKFLLGGVWVAGVSYALGVIGTYFTTGGVDGKGPTGL
ncbi:hypothetical protein PG990_010462 [Apiospora arundinis]